MNAGSFIAGLLVTLVLFVIWYGASVSATLEAILRELRNKK